MPDLEVVALIAAKPGSEGIVRDALVTLAAATRQEAGCVSYAVCESELDGTFVTLETWRSRSDLDEHMTTPHIAAALRTVDEHLAQPPAIHPLRLVDGH